MDCYVYSVVRHQGYIYTVCEEYPPGSIKSIRVHDDSPPFDLLMLTLLEGVYPSVHYASDAVENCIYILDFALSCLWRFTTEDHQVTEWLSNIIHPISVTVSTKFNGQVIVLRHGEIPYELEFYGPNAALVRRIVLSGSISLLCNPDPDLRDPDLTFFAMIAYKNDTFIVMCLLPSSSDHLTELIFNLVSNKPAAIGQIISQVSVPFYNTFIYDNDNQIEVHWIWHVPGSVSKLNIDLIYRRCSTFLIVAEHLISMHQCM